MTSQTFKVLAVDDEVGIREFVGRVLRQPGYDVCVAADGAEAIQIADAEGPFDLLVTDVAMPGMAGDELARRLRQANPLIKILYFTAFSDRLFEVRPFLWEDEAFLQKPVGAQGLLEAAALLLVGRVPAPRAVRVRIPGAQVRFSDSLTTLESLSVNGGLMHAAGAAPVGSILPLVLELPSNTIHVKAKVVSCKRYEERTSCEAVADPGPFSVAFAFVDLSSTTRRTLHQVIQESTAAL